MREFITIVEKAIASTTWGYWITNKGVVLPAKSHQHSYAAMEHLGVIGDYYEEKYTYDEENIFQMGWVWVKCKDDYRTGPDRFEVSFVRGKLSSPAASALSRLARSDEYGSYALHMHGEGAHRVETTTVGDFLRSIRDAVRA